MGFVQSFFFGFAAAFAIHLVFFNRKSELCGFVAFKAKQSHKLL